MIFPDFASAVAAFAAEELAKYLDYSLKIQLKWTEKAIEGQQTIWLGIPTDDPVWGAAAGKLTGEEGYYIRVEEDALILAGGGECGILYAVYEFLEQYLGCCFGAYCAPGVDAGEIVPRYESCRLENSCICKPSADLNYRTAIVQYNNWAADADHGLNLAFIDWLGKNRYNRILTWVSVYEQYKELGLLPELEKRGIHLSVGHHESAATWLPHFGNRYFPTHYYEVHPEFYRLQADGTRFKPADENDRSGQWIYCSRNIQCIEQIAQNITAWIKENPAVDIIAFWPNDDSAPQCCCPMCTPYSKTENYAYFENEVAKRVARICPKVKIDMLVYQDLWKCPPEITLAKNLLIDESTWTPDGLRHAGKPDGSCLLDADAHNNLRTWKKKGCHVVYYDYYMGVYSNKQRIIPMADELQSIFRTFTREKVDGSGTQIECFNLWNHLLNFYCFARTAYDTELSLEEQIRRITRLFGEGAGQIADIFRIYEQTLDGQVPLQEGGRFFMEHVDGEKVYALFEQALEKADTTRTRNNIRMLRMAFRYTELEVKDSIDWEKRAQKTTAEYADPAGELAFLATHFDSFTRNDPGYAITIPATNVEDKTKTQPFYESPWYRFE